MVGLGALAAFTAIAARGCGAPEQRAATSDRAPAPAPAQEPIAPPPPGLDASPGNPAEVAAARRFLASPVFEGACGPYSLLTDLAGKKGLAVRAICGELAARLDGEYVSRLGVPLARPAAGTIVLFASRRRFRDYVAADGELPQGYAGFSLGWAGLVALPAGDIGEAELARTLAHELAHLAHRRAFGREPAPWLAEGLADVLGDSATPDGFAPLRGFEGVEGQRRRLVAVVERRAPAGATTELERLVSLTREQFDRGAGALDYERAALFVRFLLLDRELEPRFRAWLSEQARQGGSPQSLPAALAMEWPSLERRFAAWLDGG